MKADKSKEIFDKFNELEDDRVKIKMKNNEVLHGLLVGYYYGDEEYFIRAWDFLEEKYLDTHTIEYLDHPKIVQINHIDIGEIYFLGDDTDIICI